MQAMVLVEPRRPLELRELVDPRPQPGQVLLRVRACGVCRTDLHVADGELPDPKLPLVLGHEIVGIVEEGGSRLAKGTHTRVTGTIGDTYLTLADDVLQAGIGKFPTATKKLSALVA